MKKIQVALTCVAAFVSGAAVADSQSNGATPFDQLKLSAAANSFSAAANGATETASGCTVSKTDNVTVDGGYYVLESDLTESAPLVVTQTPSKTNIVEKFDIAFKAAFVDESDLPTTSLLSGAKFGFALTGADAASYYNGSAWNTATNKADVVKLAVTEDTDYRLHVDYDARELKARFILDTTPNAYTSQWFSVGKIESNVISVLGAGSVKSLVGANYSIAAEVIIVTPPGGSATPMKFSETQMSALRAQVGGVDSDVVAKLNSGDEQANGLKPMDNFILFGTVKDAEITSDTKPLAAGVPLAPGNAGKVKVSLANVNLQQVGGATVTFKLMGSTDNSTDISTWTEVDTSTGTPDLEFKTDTTYRYFKVKTTITYGSAN